VAARPKSRGTMARGLLPPQAQRSDPAPSDRTDGARLGARTFDPALRAPASHTPPPSEVRMKVATVVRHGPTRRTKAVVVARRVRCRSTARPQRHSGRRPSGSAARAGCSRSLLAHDRHFGDTEPASCRDKWVGR
jgi:hypothetical protein